MPKPKNIVGIDPGKTGGLIILNRSGEISHRRRFDDGTLLALESIPSLKDSVVILERVHAMPGQGVTSMFSFGEGYGFIKGYLAAKGVEPILVSPRVWQKVSGGSGKEAVASFVVGRYGKEAFLFPRCRKAHSGCVDAAGMALWYLTSRAQP